MESTRFDGFGGATLTVVKGPVTSVSNSKVYMKGTVYDEVRFGRDDYIENVVVHSRVGHFFNVGKEGTFYLIFIQGKNFLVAAEDVQEFLMEKDDLITGLDAPTIRLLLKMLLFIFLPIVGWALLGIAIPILSFIIYKERKSLRSIVTHLNTVKSEAFDRIEQEGKAA